MYKGANPCLPCQRMFSLAILNELIDPGHNPARWAAHDKEDSVDGKIWSF
jgi:hypothetical protein